MTSLTPAQTKQKLIELGKKQIHVYIDGPPGIGKSTIAKEVAQMFKNSIVIEDQPITPQILRECRWIIALGNPKPNFKTITMRVCPKEWIEWAKKKNISPDIINLIERKPEYLEKSSPKRWEDADSFYKLNEAQDVMYIIIGSIVGKEAAAELLNFEDPFDLDF